MVVVMAEALSSLLGRRPSGLARAARNLQAIVLAAAFPFAGCGGTDEGRPSAEVATDSGASDPCKADQGLVFQNILNFEEEAGTASCDLALEPNAGAASQCPYFNFDIDNSPRQCPIPDVKDCKLLDGTQAPPEMCVKSVPGIGSTLRNTPIEGGSRCGTSRSALHLTGQNLAMCVSPTTMRQGWGATLAIRFNLSTTSGQPDHPFDASAWEGLSFWVKNGGNPAAGTAILAGVQDPYTALGPPNPKKDDGLPVYEMNYCSTATIDADANKCDPFSIATLLTDEWRFIKIPFDRMQQKGFGKPTPTGKLEVSALTGLQFGMSAGNWDFWLDDIAFYRVAP
jgi:hypothetical protein